jgi:hypothetical protein
VGSFADKISAYRFLRGLEAELTKRLPLPHEMKMLMTRLAEEEKSPSKIRENIFLYYVLPIVTNHMQTIEGIGPDEARLSMLCEYHDKVQNISSGNPFRRAGHPFSKKGKLDVSKIMQSWTKEEGVLPANQAFPDFAFRRPFPHNIVFVSKYFCDDGQTAGNTALVEGVYETLFYRCLSHVPPSHDPRDPGWDYDFGCLIAYDASEDGVLKRAWDSVMSKDMFWNGASIFIMIIRGQASSS